MFPSPAIEVIATAGYEVDGSQDDDLLIQSARDVEDMKKRSKLLVGGMGVAQ